ncbi:hypothetical protein LSAT2_021992 [Lamellibrachia satsuma]|nr:hypothetical protein LSAT2_021992 [Lamellibrachia satsuma]
MSDLLLLTRPDSHDRLVVTEDPIILQDVISHDFTRQHPSEFVLAVAGCHGDRHVREMRLLTFCAPNIEEKTTWCNILIQRVTTQRLISRNSVDSFL